jgi:antitoxin YefM
LSPGHTSGAQLLPISKAKDRLDEPVEAASVIHEQVTITKNGATAAVLLGADGYGYRA